MEGIDFSLGSLLEGGKGLRRNRPLSLNQEQAAVAAQPLAGPKDSLEGYVPSSLIPAERRVAALAAGGVPAWSRRLRRIDRLVDEALETLRAAWRELAQRHADDPAAFSAAWRARAEQAEFGAVDELIRRHNLYFPAEARLAMDPRTGDFIGIGGGDFRRRPLDLAWVLETFPPDLSVAVRSLSLSS